MITPNPPDTLQEAYEIIRDHPALHTVLPETGLELCHVYKQEIIALYELPLMPVSERAEYLGRTLYTPFQDFWRCFGFPDKAQFGAQMAAGYHEAEGQLDQYILQPGFQLPFTVDFEAVFTEIAGKVATMSGRIPRGRWFLEFSMGGDLGGFGNGDMFANLMNIGSRSDIDHLRFMLPHEMNHQILGDTHADEPYTLLRSILEEGFSCFFNDLFWDRRYSPARNIDFTEEEWTWSLANERKIFEAAEPHLHTTDQAIIDTFHRWHEYVWPDTPDRLAYFIGFRLCEAYVAQHGPDSWKAIYDQSIVQTFQLSAYERFIAGTD